MTLTTTSIVLMICFAAFIVIWVVVTLGIPSYLLGKVGLIGDKDPLEGLCNGVCSTNWKHADVCTHCLSFIGHDEWMTRICLSCGEKINIMRASSVTRKIVHKGKWIRQLNLNGKIYLNKVLFEKEK